MFLIKDKIKEYAEFIYDLFCKIVIPVWLLSFIIAITIFLFLPFLGLLVLFLLLILFLNLIAGIFSSIYYLIIGRLSKSKEFTDIGIMILIKQVVPSFLALLVLSIIGVF